MLASALLCSLVLAVLAPCAGRVLCVADPLAPADAIVVLGGEGHNPSRTTHAVELYFAGLAPQVVFSGGSVVGPDGRSTSLIERSRAAGLRMGLSPAVMISAPEAYSTYDEAQNLRAMAAEHGWSTLIVVTDDYHSYRAARVFRAANPGLTIILSPAPRSGYGPSGWWNNALDIHYICSELLKLAYYGLRYGIAPF